jgi:hypothetical protein
MLKEFVLFIGGINHADCIQFVTISVKNKTITNT